MQLPFASSTFNGSSGTALTAYADIFSGTTFTDVAAFRYGGGTGDNFVLNNDKKSVSFTGANVQGGLQLVGASGVTPPSSDFTINVDVTAVGGFQQCLFYLSYTDANNNVFAHFDGDASANQTSRQVVEVIKRVAGTQTFLGRFDQVTNNGGTPFFSATPATWSIIVEGTQVSMAINGTQVISPVTVPARTVGPIYWSCFNETSPGTLNTYANLQVIPHIPVVGSVRWIATAATSITLSGIATTSDYGPITYQYQVAPDAAGSPGTYATVGSPQTAASGVVPGSVSKTDFTAGNYYWSRYIATDANGHAVTTRAVKMLMRQSATYYLDNAGNNANAGTSLSAAWQTPAATTSFVFVPGDRLLLTGGQSFTGTITANIVGGQPDRPAIITSSTATPATINITVAGAHGIACTNCQGLAINTLTLVGPGISSTNGTSTSTGDAVHVMSDQTTTGVSYLDTFLVNRVTASGFFNGILVGVNGSNVSPEYPAYNMAGTAVGIRNVSVTNCVVTSALNVGIFITTPFNDQSIRNNTFFKNVNVLQNEVSNVYGSVTAYGCPVAVYCTYNAMVAYNNLHDSAAFTNEAEGILIAQCTNSIFKCNEIYNMLSSDHYTDGGGGIDIDLNCANVIVEYNYTHNNVAAGLYAYANESSTQHLSTGSVFRYNISVNDGLNGHGSVAIIGETDVLFHNNIIYSNVSGTVLVGAGGNGGTFSGGNFYNNVFYAVNGYLMSVGAVGIFKGNCWYNPAGFSLFWGATYSSLAAWQVVGQEKLSGNPVGSSVNPLFLNAGNAPTIGGTSGPGALTAYNLQLASPLSGKGLSLSANFGIDPGTTNFHGSPVGSPLSVGATVVDVVSPVISSATITTAGTINVLYAEQDSLPVLPATGVSGFTLLGTSAVITGGSATSISYSGAILSTDAPLLLALTNNNVTDSAGNQMGSQIVPVALAKPILTPTDLANVEAIVKANAVKIVRATTA